MVVERKDVRCGVSEVSEWFVDGAIWCLLYTFPPCCVCVCVCVLIL